ncbi:carbamoyltransferase family protein [Desulfospira joergensenii]|uniref:carbamoyltransferase family protein n=1 Tax=Desulfospira joergensenii TaxID=53329 RepID=UPI0003B6A413|nr:carbamoyltransferase [Desulfospira joergensenii]
MTAILGISAFYHDSASALIVDGEIIAAAQEERFTRRKHDSSYPKNAINYVLAEGRLTLDQVEYAVFYDKPFLKFERLLETYVRNVPNGINSFCRAMPIWLREKLFLKPILLKELKSLAKGFVPGQLFFSEHHFSHAASAFYPSPFEEAVVLTIDGVGEWATTSVGIGRGNHLEIVKEIRFPHSIGLLYSSFTYYTGFRVNSGEYKLMGLAPYGEPKYKNLIFEKLVDLKADGSYCLDQSYFNYATGLTMTNEKFEELFGQPVRKPESELSQFHMDIAASIQAATEDIVMTMTTALSKEYDIPNLCMAGGVALNCVVNGKILKAKSFKDLWIQPAAGDAGGAIGSALGLWYSELNKPRAINPVDSMKGAYLGPAFNQKSIEQDLIGCGARFETVSYQDLLEQTAQALSEGKAVGWFQGRMEFGPRALGNRSILGNPKSETMQKTLNLKIKYRESFRPFAPSVLREDLSDWFELNYDSPYMLLVDEVKRNKQYQLTMEETSLFGIEKLNTKRSEIPAVTHVDYSARIQTVHKKTNPMYFDLICKFREKTGCPVLVNTSFNVRGEPIVCDPEDAFRCFMGTEIDMLVIGNCILKKDEQEQALISNYNDKYTLD